MLLIEKRGQVILMLGPSSCACSLIEGHESRLKLNSSCRGAFRLSANGFRLFPGFFFALSPQRFEFAAALMKIFLQRFFFELHLHFHTMKRVFELFGLMQPLRFNFANFLVFLLDGILNDAFQRLA